MKYEQDYVAIVESLLNKGYVRATRNDKKSLSNFFTTLSFNVTHRLPLLLGRHVYLRGVLGELAAMVRKPKHIHDFKKFGCNYWDLWAKEDGSLNIDYGNEWHKNNQITKLKESLRSNRHSRRMIISGWNPANLDSLSLPCCHFLYHFYYDEGTLSLNWYQRSCDVMIGLPSNMIFASLLLILVAHEFDLVPRTVNMALGDYHIYSKHVAEAHKYVNRAKTLYNYGLHGKYELLSDKGKDFCSFEPEDISIIQHRSHKIKLELYK